MRLPVTIGVGGGLWLILAWLIPNSAGLTPRKTLALQLILTLAGLMICGLLVWFRKQNEPTVRSSDGNTPPGPEQSQIANVLNEAETKLASSALERGTRLNRMPVVIVTGFEGAGKTTAIVQSSLEPELLSGQVSQEGLIVPTAGGNAWLAQRTVFLEVGPDVQSSPRSWKTISKLIQPSKMKLAIGSRGTAPRAVIVCYECDELLKQGATEAAVASAKTIRKQLYELSKGLGSNLPIYVLFTKLDRVAFFFDFVRNLSEAESRQILGVTLDAEKRDTGVYGEREAARLTDTFQELAVSLSDKRTDLLTREGDADASLSAYEFPREFRKLRGAAIKFLLELCRPSQLDIGPFLRGFYFSGVRPIVVNDEIAAEVRRPDQNSFTDPVNLGATNIFYQRSSLEVEAEATIATATNRRVPEWVFLPPFFKDVVLGDRGGQTASALSKKANLSRRLLLAITAALCLLFATGTLNSYLKNRALLKSVQDAAEAVLSDKPASAEAIPLESLTKLDTLRQTLVRLTYYERTNPPLGMRWGLYSGSQVLPEAKTIYFARFRTLLFTDLNADLLSVMRNWPATPSSQADYGFAYNSLKAYLEMTSHHEKATLSFLPPLLQERWSGEKVIDQNKVALARRQFDFYTSELILKNPFSLSPDAQTVAKARQYLAQFAGIARVYQAMLTEANQNAKSIIFNRQFPGSSVVVVNNVEIRGAFTKPGFAFVEGAIKNPSKYVSGEKWVLGEQGPIAAEMPNLAQQAQTLYYRDYIAAWRDYLRKSIVVRYVSLADAVRKLNITSSPQSPLLALFWLASQNTDVAAAPVEQAFRPLHTLMPPASVNQYVGPSNSNYMTSLTALQSSVDQASKLPPEQSQAAADQVSSAASAALLVTKQTALTLGLDPDAHIEATIQKLMTDPITYVDAVKPNGASPVPLNSAGAEFCSKYRLLAAKYPFDPNAKTEASLDDLQTIFRPQQGALWQFYDAKLSKVLVRQGNGFVPVAGQSPKLMPRFVSFFNNAARFSAALYSGGAATEAKLTFALQPAFSSNIQSVAIAINGQSADLLSNSPPKQFTWPGSGSGVRLVAKSGADFTYPNYEGLWGVFEFFSDADRPVPSPEWTLKAGRSDKPVTSPVTNQPIAVHFNLDMMGGPPVFQKNYFRELTCVSEVAR